MDCHRDIIFSAKVSPLMAITSTILSILFALITIFSYNLKMYYKLNLTRIKPKTMKILISKYHQILATLYAVLVIIYDFLIIYANSLINGDSSNNSKLPKVVNNIVSIWISINLLSVIILFASFFSIDKHRALIYVVYPIHMSGAFFIIIDGIIELIITSSHFFNNLIVIGLTLLLFLFSASMTFYLPSAFIMDKDRIKYESNRYNNPNGSGISYLLLNKKQEQQQNQNEEDEEEDEEDEEEEKKHEMVELYTLK